MADHIPFITSEEGCNLLKKTYSDSAMVRVPLYGASRYLNLMPSKNKVWLDPGVEGMGDLNTRRTNWLDFMRKFTNFEKINRQGNLAKPAQKEVDDFVSDILDACAKYKPAWITVPQLPLVSTSDRNKINRALAAATGRWSSSSEFSGRLILPLVFTNQEQINGKTKRNPKVKQAERCYYEGQANGFWVVDKSLTDDSGSYTLRNKRFPSLIDLHEELNARISSKIRIAGPYWGLNLVLWARGLVDHPGIGIGSGYQFFLAGGHSKQPKARIALPSLRRRVVVRPQLRTWLDAAIAKLSPSHPVRTELRDIKKNFTALSELAVAREQVGKFYKHWFDIIASTPRAGRSMALFQDLSSAYALGKSLPILVDEGTARRPEAVVEPLMLSCL